VIDKVTVVLQNCTDTLNIEPGLCNQTYVTSSCDGTDAIDVKAEDVSNVREEQDPVPTTNAKPEVCYMSHFTDVKSPVFSFLSPSVSVCMTPLR
jgi:hypothetical protein